MCFLFIWSQILVILITETDIVAHHHFTSHLVKFILLLCHYSSNQVSVAIRLLSHLAMVQTFLCINKSNS